MKSNKLMLLLIVVSVLGLILALYTYPNQDSKSIPDRDIVYIDHPLTDPRLVFSNPNRSGLVIISSFQPGDSAAWSPSGAFLGVKIIPTASSDHYKFILMGTDGGYKQCPEMPNFHGPIRFITDTTIGLINNRATFYEILAYDLVACREMGSIFKSQLGEQIGDFDFSSQGWLAIEILKGDQNVGVWIYKDNQKIYEIPDAQLPYWSKDGNLLAYISTSFLNLDELLIITKEGTDLKRYGGVALLFQGNSLGWSPDNHFVLFGESKYNVDGVKKVDLTTGEIIEFCKKCISPSWR